MNCSHAIEGWISIHYRYHQINLNSTDNIRTVTNATQLDERNDYVNYCEQNISSEGFFFVYVI